MKQISIILFLLIYSHSVYSQEFSDSAYIGAEIEDSVSAMAIKRIEHPEQLLKQALGRLNTDLDKKHSKRSYSQEVTYSIPNDLLTCSRIITIQGDDGIDIRNTEHAVKGSLSFGQHHVSKEDSLKIEFDIVADCYLNSIHTRGLRWETVQIYDIFKYYDLDVICKKLASDYKLTAYSIGDETGRGLYRIHLEEKPQTREPENECLFHIKLYLDRQSLRLIQLNETQYRLRGSRCIFRNDFVEENGAPILSKSTQIYIEDGQVKRKTSIRLLEN